MGAPLQSRRCLTELTAELASGCSTVVGSNPSDTSIAATAGPVFDRVAPPYEAAGAVNRAAMRRRG